MSVLSTVHRAASDSNAAQKRIADPTARQPAGGAVGEQLQPVAVPCAPVADIPLAAFAAAELPTGAFVRGVRDLLEQVGSVGLARSV